MRSWPRSTALGAALPTTWLLPLGLCAALVTLAGELGVFGFRIPIHRRQVNERWLDQFRPWVYGAGFGWQIGSGLATYVVTPAVYLMIVLAALSGRSVGCAGASGRASDWSVA